MNQQFAIKAEAREPRAKTFSFSAMKTMYGGKQVAEGDTIFIFASENEGGTGLIARGVVTSARAVPRKTGLARAVFRLERRPARNGAQLQVLSPGSQQDRRHLR